jgi:hypothetical protein
MTAIVFQQDTRKRCGSWKCYPLKHFGRALHQRYRNCTDLALTCRKSSVKQGGSYLQWDNISQLFRPALRQGLEMYRRFWRFHTQADRLLANRTRLIHKSCFRTNSAEHMTTGFDSINREDKGSSKARRKQ